MANASGVEAARRDRGEARRNGVISRPFRRLCVCVRVTIISISHENFTSLYPLFTFFQLYLVEIVPVKTASTLKAPFLTRRYENNGEANCKATGERKAVRRLRIRVIAVLAK
jgi:hypothetical protein